MKWAEQGAWIIEYCLEAKRATDQKLAMFFRLVSAHCGVKAQTACGQTPAEHLLCCGLFLCRCVQTK